MGYWLLQCSECKLEWKLYVSFPLKREFSKIYHYCPYCNKNTFHRIIDYVEE
ncbi:MAG: hypothetical protein LM556_00400 [Desulfurococcaceae archaeon]|nr:hypothetical protein [Desulfurococcaceae archaeon]